MRKIITLTTIAIIAVSFASCKKQYSCSCETKSTGIPTTYTKQSLGKSSKKVAEAACNSISTSFASMGDTVTMTCKLD